MKHIKILALAAAGFAAGSTMASAATMITFDNVSSGSSATSAGPAGVSFFNAVFVPDLDEFGDPISGSEKWQIDMQAPSVLAQNPHYLDFETSTYGDAPSPLNALDAIWQPVLIRFDQPISLESFSVTLDNSSLGEPGNWQILFTSRSGNTDTYVGSIDTDQSIAGLVASHNGPLLDVTQILLPAGAFYDNITFTAVPEPGSAAFFILGGLIAGVRRGRKF